MSLISYIHLFITIYIYESFPLTFLTDREQSYWRLFEKICHYNVYKFRLHHDFLLEIFWIVLFILFFFELLYKYKYPNKLKSLNIENKFLNIVHGIFFYFSYIYMFYVCSIYLFYLLVILFIISVILTSQVVLSISSPPQKL